jgi:hypothetical protein
MTGRAIPTRAAKPSAIRDSEGMLRWLWREFTGGHRRDFERWDREQTRLALEHLERIERTIRYMR